jgi:hypothetical protein
MIRHYAVIVAEFDEESGEEFMDLSIDHHFLLAHFGGVAFDTESEKWLSPGVLSEKAQEHDSNFLGFIASSIYNQSTT